MTIRNILFVFVLASFSIGSQAETITKNEAIFAGGCFWCVESDFDKIPGVLETISGYIGGSEGVVPTYKTVSSGRTRYVEAVRIQFNPNVVSYEQLLNIYWKSIDPTVKNQQFCDVGRQYRTEIFYVNEEQRLSALASKKSLEASKPFNQPIVTLISKATKFYPAEGYHQDYHNKNPVRYKYYRWNCGRDQRLESLWGT